MSRFALALALLLAGCPTTPAPSDGGSALDVPAAIDGLSLDAPSASLETYCRPVGVFLCESARDCGCGEVLPGGALDVDACVAAFEAECEAAWAPFVAAGAFVDGDLAMACAATIAASTAPCERPSGVAAFALCEPFVIDPGRIGGPCSSPYCAGGDGYCNDGTCTRRGAAGESCGDMFSCQTGLVCQEGSCAVLLGDAAACTTDLECAPPLACVSGACGPLRAAGAACDDTVQCAYGLVCATGTCAARTAVTCDPSTPCGNREICASPPTCRAPLGSGAACSENADCASDLYCDSSASACTTRPASGEACGNGVSCAAGLGCDMDGGTCRALPGDGMPCLFGELGPFLCASGLACNAGTCGPIPGEGEPCAGTDTCAPGLGCAFGPSGSICIVPRGVGETCENRQACRADLFCGSSGTCEVDVAIGATCSPDLGNCGGACVPDASGGFTCSAAVAEGDTCLADADCTSGLTCLRRPDDTRCLADVCTTL